MPEIFVRKGKRAGTTGAFSANGSWYKVLSASSSGTGSIVLDNGETKTVPVRAVGTVANSNSYSFSGLLENTVLFGNTVVALNGCFSSPSTSWTANTQILNALQVGTLPAGFRPSAAMNNLPVSCFSAYSNSGAMQGFINISTAGAITLTARNNGATAWTGNLQFHVSISFMGAVA